MQSNVKKNNIKGKTVENDSSDESSADSSAETSPVKKPVTVVLLHYKKLKICRKLNVETIKLDFNAVNCALSKKRSSRYALHICFSQ